VILPAVTQGGYLALGHWCAARPVAAAWQAQAARRTSCTAAAADLPPLFAERDRQRGSEGVMALWQSCPALRQDAPPRRLPPRRSSGIDGRPKPGICSTSAPVSSPAPCWPWWSQLQRRHPSAGPVRKDEQTSVPPAAELLQPSDPAAAQREMEQAQAYLEGRAQQPQDTAYRPGRADGEQHALFERPTTITGRITPSDARGLGTARFCRPRRYSICRN
jgi:hypothetical protein